MSGNGRSYGERGAQNRGVVPTRRGSAVHPLAALQRKVGNQAVAGMFVQREGDDEEVQMSRDPAATIQREGDDEEVQMARDPAITIQREGEDEEVQMSRDPAIQRAGAEVGLDGGPLSDATASEIQAMRGGGAPLDAPTRSAMEGNFGTSFGDVRVHTGPEASDVSRRIGALAFTSGSDVFMRDDAYRPGTPDANRLLGHELTHVVQQRSMAPSAEGMHVGPAGDHHEQAADAKGSEVANQLGAGPI
jgi:hypothetical protein